MQNPTELAVVGPKAIEVCQYVQLEKPARKLAREDLSAIEFVGILAEHGHFSDAVRVVAHLLPPRESVWWACQCARQAAVPDPQPEWTAGVVAAERWVTELTEESRRAAGVAAYEAELNTAAGCAAMAAFGSGGSLTPPDAPLVPPGQYLTAQLVTGSITVSALSPDPREAPGKYRTFLDQGLELYRSTVAAA